MAKIAEKKEVPRAWYLGFGLAVAGLLNLGAMIGYLVWTGVGVWGNNVPVGWGWPIVNFVFWIGIGHAGTLISADPLPVPSEVAHVHQPGVRGHDAVRRDGVCGRLPNAIHVGRDMGDLLHVAAAQLR